MTTPGRYFTYVSVSAHDSHEDSPEDLEGKELQGQHRKVKSDSRMMLLVSEDVKSPKSRYRSIRNQMLSRTITRVKSKLPTGWRFGAWLAVFQASAVLLTNIIILVWSAMKSGGNAIGIAFQGDCDTMDRYSVGIHLLINVLSTVLLGASNYMMQTLCAPTRAEVDRAHERGIWLDIGLQSMRNLKYMSRMKRILWVALSISSIPLHLFYNSSFFSTISAENYPVIPAMGPDLRTITPNADGRYNWTCGYGGCPSDVPEAELSQWDVLNNAECIEAYATDFVSDRAVVIPVMGDYVSNDTLTAMFRASGGTDFWGIGGDPYGWICSGINIDYQTDPLGCLSVWRDIDPSKWTCTVAEANHSAITAPFKINYCLSQPIVPKCQLNFNVPLLVLVIMFNIVKVTCIAFAAMTINDNALVTIGDAIASFTSDPDIHTRNMCLASGDIFDGREIGKTVCLEFQSQRIRWFRAASKRHWMMTLLFFAVAISAIISLLSHGIMDQLGTGIDFSAFWQWGIGTAHAQTIISGWKIPTDGYRALVASVFVSNSPQLILSIIYLLFNSLCTKMFLAKEWFSYSRARKPLRVSIPQGEQRSTYFLQIPYRFGLPLMVYSILLHWLVSQSIFLVQLTYYDELANDDTIAILTITSCGFSPLGMILTLIVGVTLILGAFMFAFFAHFNGDMPFVGSCSAATSASCHPPIPDGSDPLKPMKWGAVIGSGSDDGKRSGVGHVSFSSGDVFDPIPGCYYS